MIAFVLPLVALLSAAPAGAREAEAVRLPPPVEDAPFVFGPGDRFAVKVYKHPDLDTDVTVAPDGTITFPLVGRMEVAGRGYAEIVAEIEAALRAYYTDVSVAVNVIEVNNQKVFVVGEVEQPMVLQITGELTLLEALVRTGGINPDARTDNLLLIRGGLDAPQLYLIDVGALLEGDTAQNVELQKDDILVVPTKTIVNVERFFRRIQGILSPFVSATQVYRNTQIGGDRVIEDEPSP